MLVISSHAHRPHMDNQAYLELSPHGSDDGKLTPTEIAVMDLTGVELVILSGCGTLLKKGDNGEAFVSLSDAFLFAGARNVVGTLWEVNDKMTYRFVRQLLEHYDSSHNAGEAIARVQRSFVRGDLAQAPLDLPSTTRGIIVEPIPVEQEFSGQDLKHPYFWAPFVLLRHTAFLSPQVAKKIPQ